MGNSYCLLNYHSPLSFQDGLDDQIEMVSSYNHPTFGMIQIWKIRQHIKPTIFSRIYYINEADSQFEQEHQLRCTINHQNLLQYYASTQEQASYFGSVVKEQQFFEFQPKSLENLLMRKFQFLELDIWKFLSQASDLGAYLYENNIAMQKNVASQRLFNLSTIFFTKNGDIKVFVNQFHSINQEKEDIYDMGLIALQMIMGDRISMANDRASLMIEIAMAQSRYQFSLQLLQLLSKLITNHQNMRPQSFREVKNLIANRQSQAIVFNQGSLRLSSIRQKTLINPLAKGQQQQQSVIQYQPISYMSTKQQFNSSQSFIEFKQIQQQIINNNTIPIQQQNINIQGGINKSKVTQPTQPSSNQGSPLQQK